MEKFEKSDSKMDIHKCLDGTRFNSKELKAKWTQSYFPDQFPKVFHNPIESLDKSGASDYFDYYSIVFLKSYKSSLHMKILHPKAFSKLSEQIYDSIFGKLNENLQNSWSVPNVYYKGSLESIIEFRKKFLTNGQYSSRFDIIQFYQSFYVHVLSWIAAKSRNAGKVEFDEGKITNWAAALDKAIEHVQWKQTRGLPIGSHMIDELAEAILIYIDGIVYERFIDKKVDTETFQVCRSGDNYEIVADTPETCKLVENAYTCVLHGLELNIQFEYGWACCRFSDNIRDPFLIIKAASLDEKLRIVEEASKKNSMDYGLLLEEYVNSSTTSCSIKHIKNLLKKHPKSVKYILDTVVDKKLIDSISDCLLACIDEFVFGGLTCQFICILAFVKKHYSLIGSKWMIKNNSNSSFNSILDTYMNDPIVAAYQVVLKDEETSSTALNVNVIIDRFRDELERPSVRKE
eukprot:NODE_11_length_46995_cov_0.451872.p9 type:complete len:460 gc:universal NODE_11_length_46995_cov_0.451872:39018-37639(-)